MRKELLDTHESRGEEGAPFDGGSIRGGEEADAGTYVNLGDEGSVMSLRAGMAMASWEMVELTGLLRWRFAATGLPTDDLAEPLARGLLAAPRSG